MVAFGRPSPALGGTDPESGFTLDKGDVAGDGVVGTDALFNTGATVVLDGTDNNSGTVGNFV